MHPDMLLRFLVAILLVFAGFIFTGCPYEPVELSNPADPNASTPVEQTVEEIDDPNLAEAVLQSADEHGWEYSQDVEKVEARYAGVTSLAGIELFFALETLDLRGNQVESIEPLRAFDSLSDLNVEGNDLDSIEPLEDLQVNDRLVLADNEITDLSPLLQHNAPESLILYFNPLEPDDLYALAEESWLNSVEIYHFGVEGDAEIDLSRVGLGDMSNLCELGIVTERVTNLDVLADLGSMKRLGFSGVEITDPPAIFEELTQLTGLMFESNNATAQTFNEMGGSELEGLEEIEFLDTNIKDIGNLEMNSSEMHQPNFSYNDQVTDLDGVGVFSDSRRFYVLDNENLEDFEGLDELSVGNLMVRRNAQFGNDDLEYAVSAINKYDERPWYLDVSSTAVTDVSELGEISHISHINLSNLDIEDGIREVAEINGLERVEIENSGLTEDDEDVEFLIEQIGEENVEL